jgi:hypothetical protein
MTDRDAMKARAAALFRKLVAQGRRDALAEEKTRIELEIAKELFRFDTWPAAGGRPHHFPCHVDFFAPIAHGRPLVYAATHSNHLAVTGAVIAA